MGSDKARSTFDERRMYRSVVLQQGKVTLEADGNEADKIRAEESRAELIEIVGPAGSPDHGFEISIPSPNQTPFNFAIGAGTLYVGGLRVHTGATTYFGQKTNEWLDYPAGAPPAGAAEQSLSELVYLSVVEQEVSAVEDPALREVALGGPDSAARTRLVQRVVRVPSSGGSCSAALKAAIEGTAGTVGFDAATMRVESKMWLKADFLPSGSPPDACQPTAQGGFLGAENQLIRVQVTREGKLLWGYDNASFLYRVSVASTTPTTVTLKLAGTPVDVFHQPRANQWVEVLDSAVALPEDAKVAAPVGLVAQVATAYDPTTGTLTLNATLPAPASPVESRQLFLRVWENQQTFAANDTTPTQLMASDNTGTGVYVWTRGTARVPGDYWMISVRPGLPAGDPQAIGPARLRADFQPPHGPSRWVAPLARITWDAGGATGKVSDCRRRFRPLVDQGCCEVVISPDDDDIPGTVADALQWMRTHDLTGLHLRFSAGTFQLAEPLRLVSTGGETVTVSGCGLTSKLVAAKRESALVLEGWDRAGVFDLVAEAGTAQPGQAGEQFRHLGGAIMLLRCGSSAVERVWATCAPGGPRSASCITIDSDNSSPGDVRVRSCELMVGAGQVGTLLVNVGRATVDDNQVRLAGRDPFDLEQLRRLLLEDARFDDSPVGPQPGARVTMRFPPVNGLALHFVTERELIAGWRKLIALVGETPIPFVDPTELKRRPRRAVERALETIDELLTGMVAQLFDQSLPGPLSPDLLKFFGDWFGRTRTKPPLAAGQGIVVAGTVARDVRVTNNTVTAAMDGVHIGVSAVSARGNKRPPALLANRVQVAGNTIAVRVPKGARGAHAGIFIGNVENATVRDNQVIVQANDLMRDLTGALQTKDLMRGADGIRVWGVAGPALTLTGNRTKNADVGVRVVQAREMPVQFRALDAYIDDNTIEGGPDGIRVVLVPSSSEAELPRRLHRLQVKGNAIALDVPLQDTSGKHAGIFVENGMSATLRDNHVDVEIGLAEGIQVAGPLGPLLLVTGNVTTSASVGIRVLRSPPTTFPGIWQIIQNVAVRAGTPIVAPAVMIDPLNRP